MAAQEQDLDHDLEKLSAQIGDITKRLQGGAKAASSARLASSVRELLWALEGPEICLANLAQATVGFGAFRTAIELEIFQNFGSGPTRVDGLAKACGASEKLLARIMRVLTGHGIYKLSAPQTYAHTTLSMALQNPLVVAVARGLAEQATMIPKLPEYLASISYQDPQSGKEGFFPYAMDTPLTKYEWLEEHPKQLKIFQDFQGAKDEMTGENLKDRLKDIIRKEAIRHQEGGTQADQAELPVLFCDVGGGRGKLLKQATDEVLAEDGKLDGRVITEDLPNVVKGQESTKVWEAIPHDFFNEQPVKGAYTYQLRDCLHNWSDEASKKILAQTVAAMAPYSRILITETVLPETDVPLLLANMDIYMMQFGGMERTEEDWKQLLQSAKLKLERVESPERGSRSGEFLLWAVPES